MLFVFFTTPPQEEGARTHASVPPTLLDHPPPSIPFLTSPPPSLSLYLYIYLSPTHSLFRTYLTGKQYHRRLTDGWRSFCTSNGLAMGDAIHFWRDPRDDVDPSAGQHGGGEDGGDGPPALTLRVRIVRGAVRMPEW